MVPFRALIAFIALAGVGASASIACAQDASPWVKDAHSSLRLLAGSRTGSVLMGGIEIQLQPGWKTYWRTPGDSGVPPRFDFSKSVNVESVTPLYPAPRTFDDGAGGMSYGYIEARHLPASHRAEESERAGAAARLDQLRGLRKALPAGRGRSRTVVHQRRQRARQPGRNRAQQGAETGRHIRGNAARAFDPSSAIGDRVMVDVAAQNPAALELFAEGPTAGLGPAGPETDRREPENGIVRFEFKLDGLPPNARGEGALLKLTVVGADGAFEYNVRLN